MLDQAKAIADQLVEWRREFHMHPELGFQEHRTAQRVADELMSLGYRVLTGVGRTGVVGDIGEGSPTLGIRADMDALPIQEASDVPYASQVSGVMHACGHDAHTAIALGVAKLLSQEKFPGRVRFLFQPAEEVADDEGISGAPRMVEDGALEGVDNVIALHVDATVQTGSITVEAGPSSAGVDTLYATILGRGGHGAYPHEVIDPIYISSHVIQALHGIVSRRIRPTEPAVVSIGSIHGGDADNVIPDRVDLTGTLRFMTKEVQTQLHEEIERALSLAKVHGGNFTHRIAIGYPPMINDQEVTDLIRDVAVESLGEEHVRPPIPEMGAEDFAYFSSLAPGAMFMLGCLIEGDERKHHNARFDIDEHCLPIGAGLLAEISLRYLRGS